MKRVSPPDQLASEILRRPYVRRLQSDPGGGFTVTVAEFPGCVAEGDTADEALQCFEAAAASWIVVALANGFAIPLPAPTDVGGKIALRLPRSLHKQMLLRAEAEGCSLNQLLVVAIASYAGAGVQCTFCKTKMGGVGTG